MEANIAKPGAPQTASRQSVAFDSRLPWSQSRHLLLLAPPLVADAIDILIPIGVAWTNESAKPTANTSPRIEASIRRSQKPIMT